MPRPGHCTGNSGTQPTASPKHDRSAVQSFGPSYTQAINRRYAEPDRFSKVAFRPCTSTKSLTFCTSRGTFTSTPLRRGWSKVRKLGSIRVTANTPACGTVRCQRREQSCAISETHGLSALRRGPKITGKVRASVRTEIGSDVPLQVGSKCNQSSSSEHGQSGCRRREGDCVWARSRISTPMGMSQSSLMGLSQVAVAAVVTVEKMKWILAELQGRSVVRTWEAQPHRR